MVPAAAARNDDHSTMPASRAKRDHRFCDALNSSDVGSSSIGDFFSMILRQTHHVRGEKPNLSLAKRDQMRGHFVIATGGDSCGDCVEITAMNPNRVGEVRRPQCLVAFAIDTMTGRAERFEAYFPGVDPV